MTHLFVMFGKIRLVFNRVLDLRGNLGIVKEKPLIRLY